MLKVPSIDHRPRAFDVVHELGFVLLRESVTRIADIDNIHEPVSEVFISPCHKVMPCIALAMAFKALALKHESTGFLYQSVCLLLERRPLCCGSAL